MAVSTSTTWYQSWSSPNFQHTNGQYFREHHFDHRPSNQQNLHRDEHQGYQWQDDRVEYSRNYKRPSTSTNPAGFFPYLLQLSVLRPPQGQQQDTHPPNARASVYEYTGPFKTWYAWKDIDFAYSSQAEREHALFTKEYVPENNLPLGIEVYGDRVFVTLPKWKKGVPATLAVLPKVPLELSPKMVPYPNWDWHNGNGCDGLTSVYRMNVDECGRLWVLDSGQTEVTTKPKQVCPPQLFIFDLHTDELLLRYPIPDEYIKQDSLYSNIKVDVSEHRCDDAYAYMADVWRFGIVVFSLRQMKSWRVTDHLFYPDPLASSYNVKGLDFEWTDGVFGLALGPVDRRTNDRILYFHPMSSFMEFYVQTSVIKNETGWSDVKDAFKVLGQSRGKSGQSSASAMDRNGILFYNLVTRNSVGCWDSRKPYKRRNLGVVAQSNETIVFPNDMKIDMEERQSVWIITNRLPNYIYKSLDSNDYNFRIMSAYTDEAIANTICDPNNHYGGGIDNYFDDGECF